MIIVWKLEFGDWYLPAEQAVVAQACPVTLAHVAQLVEHVIGNDEVTSSILVVGSKGDRVK